MKQLIKSATVYKAELPSADALAQHLAEKPFTECQPHEIRSHGFVPVNEDSLVLEFPGGLAFGVRIDTKTIPTSEINKVVKTLTDRFIELGGRKPNKEDRLSIKDAAVLKLAETAFVKTALIRVFYHRDTGYLIVPTTSAKHCDQITSMLIQAVGSVKTETIHVSGVKHGLTTRLKNWLGHQSGEFSDGDGFGAFHPQGEVAMAQEKRKITIKMGGLEMAESAIKEAIAGGFEVTSLGLTFNGLTEFRLTHDFKFKGFGFASTPEDDDDGSYGIAATAALEVSAVADVVTHLTELLKYQEAQDSEKADTDEAGYTKGPVSDGGMDPRDIKPHLEGDGPDPMYDQAVAIVIQHQKASISLVQRHLRLGYNRSARLLERMEKEGVVSPMDQIGHRAIL